MFEHDPARVRVDGPLAPFAPGFVAELRRLGYAPKSASFQMQLTAHLSRWLVAEGLNAQGLSPAVVERFIAARRAAGYSAFRSPKALMPLLTYLRGIDVAPEPPEPAPAGTLEDLLWRYRLYLIRERGFLEPTARRYARVARPFLGERADHDGLELAELGTADVTSHLRERRAVQSPGAFRYTVTALRSLLGFLHREGEIERPLDGAVPTVAGWRLAGLPKGLEPAQVQLLLASCERERAVGRRDLAIITMLSRLGLRAGEVAALRLEDVGWRAGEIVVRGKGRRSERLPLPADVGAAIAAYLRNGRPVDAEGRSVFVRALAPHRPLSTAG